MQNDRSRVFSIFPVFSGLLIFIFFGGPTLSGSEGLEDLTRLATAGNVDAQFNLGEIYGKGLGVYVDFAIARKWYSLAAEQGDARSQYALGDIYSKGAGIPSNPTKALKWYSKAAEQGDPVYQLRLGLKCAEGKEVRKDGPQAIMWLRKSAIQGKGEAQIALWKQYLEVTPRDLVQAYVWLTIIAANGNSDAARNLQAVGTEMTDVEKEEGAKQAAELFEELANRVDSQKR